MYHSSYIREIFCTSSQSTQQAKKITGKVVDATGEPIIGASVLVKGSGTGAVTDIDGKFSVNAPIGSILEISFVGYKTSTAKVTNASSYAVTLQDDSQALSEVVVTAMGIKKERKESIRLFCTRCKQQRTFKE